MLVEKPLHGHWCHWYDSVSRLHGWRMNFARLWKTKRLPLSGTIFPNVSKSALGKVLFVVHSPYFVISSWHKMSAFFCSGQRSWRTPWWRWLNRTIDDSFLLRFGLFRLSKVVVWQCRSHVCILTLLTTFVSQTTKFENRSGWGWTDSWQAPFRREEFCTIKSMGSKKGKSF